MTECFSANCNTLLQSYKNYRVLCRSMCVSNGIYLY